MNRLSNVELAQKLSTLSPLKRTVLLKMLKKDGIDVSMFETIERGLYTGHARLSSAQQRLWFLAQLEESTANYNVPLALQLFGQLDRKALVRAVETVVERHEVLRSQFIKDGENVVQRVRDIESFTVLHGKLNASENLNDVCEREAAFEFDLSKDLLIRAKLLEVTDTKHVLLINMHHSVTDGWSMMLFFQELVDLYDAYAAGQENPLDELPIQYADYAEWQLRSSKSDAMQTQLDYWSKQLAGLNPLLPLPTDRPRPALKNYHGAVNNYEFSSALSAKLQSISQGQGTTLYMTLLAVFYMLLNRYSGQTDIAVGSPIANRRRPELEKLIGFFVNTLVMRTDLEGNPTFSDFLQRVKTTAIEAYEHQDIPFEYLVEVLQPERSMSYSPYFQVMFSLQNMPRFTADQSDIDISLVDFELKTAKFDITFNLYETDDSINAEVEYNTDLFNSTTIDQLIGHYTQLLEAVVSNPDDAIASYELLTDDEIALLVSGLNQPSTPFPQDQCIHELIEQHVAQRPDAIAVSMEQQTLTYGQLNKKANKLARYLVAQGVKPDKLVGICVERSLDMIVGLIAILKAGGGYLPLDPNYPADRLATILEDAKPEVILVQPDTQGSLPNSGIRTFCMGQGDAELHDFSDENLPVDSLQLHPRHLAYVMYTSGSTGKPKGVMIEHVQVNSYVDAMTRLCGMTSEDTYLQFCTVNFDGSVAEIFSALCNGMSLVLRTDEWLTDAKTFWQLCRENKVSLMLLPTAFWHQLAGTSFVEIPETVRVLLTGGEAMSAEKLSQWLKHKGYLPRLVNAYGPTESTVNIAFHEVSKDDLAYHSIPIGKPNPNSSMFVFDSDNRLLPFGAVGELCIGGHGIARGYLNRDDLTQDRFVVNPYASEADKQQGVDRIYKSGDLVRWLPDGNMQYIGRVDNQVKIRGFRIELAEIETKLALHEAVDFAIVVANESIAHVRRLVAYVTLAQNTEQEESALIASINEHLVGLLPDYMVPSAFVVLDKVPTTPNGKVDVKALPEPSETALTSSNYEAPSGELESYLAALWSEILDVPKVGRHDTFFSLGGHSLLLISYRTRLQEKGFELPVSALYKNLTLSEMATQLQRVSNFQIIEKGAYSGHARLSSAQQRLWFLAQLEESSANYNVPMALKLSGQLDHNALVSAVTTVVERHEVLRSQFVKEGNDFVQLVRDVDSFTVLRETLKPSENLQDVCEREATYEFDLSQDLLIRVTLLEVQAQEHILLVNMHHSVTDGWSMMLFFREMVDLYDAYTAGLNNPLNKLPIQYADYAEWQLRTAKGDVMQSQLDYWSQQLTGLNPLLPLPTDRPRPAVKNYDGAVNHYTFTPELSARLQALSQDQGVTLYMTLLSVFYMLLNRYSGQTDIAVGSPIANRVRPEVEKLIGFFVNTLVMRTDLEGNPGFTDLLQRVKTTALDAYEHQDISFEYLVEALQPERSMSYSPYFQVMFSLQNMPRFTAQQSDIEISRVDFELKTAKFDITLNLYETEDSLNAEVEYNTGLFDSATIDRLMGHYTQLLEAVVNNPDAAISSYGLLTDEEVTHLVTDLNQQDAPFPDHLRVHELFEQQVTQRPDDVAVVFDDQQLTYQQLNTRANKVAHYLVSQQVKPDDLVVLSVGPSLELMIGMLAIIKAGATYVPLEPTLPGERIQIILEDSGANIVLCTADLEAQFSHTGSHLVYLDTGSDNRGGSELFSQQPDSNISPEQVGLTPDNGLYVIYTSGSTGRPKGVMVEHRAEVNLVSWYRDLFEMGPSDKVMITSAMGFDLTQKNFFTPLCCGAAVYLSSAHLADTVKVRQFIKQHQVTFINCTPSVFYALADHPDHYADLHSLTGIVTGGEVLSHTRIAPWLQSAKGGVKFVNMYGPTECTDISTYYVIEEGFSGDAVPIGRPMDNVQLYILDDKQQLLPKGLVGELCVGGVSVARGYYKNPELTAEKYITNPFNPNAAQENDRLYRTGDLVRYSADGNVEFVGRIDNQVKVRGFRIELAEIESRLMAIGSVSEAVVITHEMNGSTRLVAYITAEEGVPEEQQHSYTESLRQALSEHLPNYMVPSAFMLMERLPLTPNGKVDRRKLPEPDVDALVQTPYEAPQGDAEKTLAALWSEVLGVANVGRNDTFFGLGGHSLLLITYRTRLNEIGFDLSVTDLYKNLTLCELVKQLQTVNNLAAPEVLVPDHCERLMPDMLPMLTLSDAQCRTIEGQIPGGAGNIADVYPLSPLQQGMLFHALSTPESDPYISKTLFKCASAASYQNLLDALAFVVSRHDTLRSKILFEGFDEPIQVVFRQVELPVNKLELSYQPDSIEDWLHDFQPPVEDNICLGNAPLFRLYVLESGGEYYVLYFRHHIIDDYVSIGVMNAEIEAWLNDTAQTLSKPTQYREFIWQSMQLDTQRVEDYFTRQLQGFEEVSSPFSITKDAAENASFVTHEGVLDEQLSADLKSVAEQNGVSIASVLHLAWSVVVSKTSGRDDVVFGSVLSGRMMPVKGIESMVGLCINTLPMRVSLANTNFKQGLKQVHEALAGLVSLENAPLSLAQNCSELGNNATLFTSILNCQLKNEDVEVDSDGSLPDKYGIQSLWSEGQDSYPVSATVDNLNDGLIVTMETTDSLDPKRFFKYYEETLTALVKIANASVDESLQASDKPLLQIDMLGKRESQYLLHIAKPADAIGTANQCIQHLFENQVNKAPNAIALEHQGQQLSYAELNQKANQLACYLHSNGINTGSVVGICIERSLEMLVAVMGILKAGAAYVPLDPSYPKNRLAHILKDASPALVLTESKQLSVLSEFDCKMVCIDDIQDKLRSFPRENLSLSGLGLTPQHLAYVLYTSGSTGLPKGVMVEHRQLHSFVQGMAKTYGVKASDRVLQFATINFDTSIEEIFSALCGGATLVLRTEEWLSDASRFWQLCTDHQISVLSLPTAFWHQVVPAAEDRIPDNVRLVILGGEALNNRKAALWFARDGHVPQLINTYGPTETTVTASSFVVSRELDWNKSVPIGKPTPNSQLYVLDNQSLLLPMGAVGELHIGGAGVARGYLEQPDVTAAKFIENPHANDLDKRNGLTRLYKTGDLVKWLPDGNLEFIGRADNQVKVRGFRVELSEIESVLSDHDPVQDCIVIAAKGQGLEVQLFAYVVVKRGAGAEAQAMQSQIREYLQGVLPEYMVPNAIILLDALPLNANGKVDKKALPAPDDSAYNQAQYVAPTTREEIALVDAMQDVLQLDKVGINDNFFALGGNSIVAIQLISRARELGLDLDMRQVFSGQTIADTAKLTRFSESSATALETQLPPISSVSQPEFLPLSFTQRRLWIISQVEDQEAGYNLPSACMIEGDLNVEALRKSFEAIIQRHATLRTVFREDPNKNQGQPYQEILQDITLNINEVDLTGYVGPEQDAKVQQLADEDAMKPFNLSEDLMLRISLLKLAPQRHVMLLNCHHIASDGWSMNVMYGEVNYFYQAYQQGESNPNLPALPLQYVDYALWQQEWMQGDVLQGYLDYWREALAGIPQMHNLPLDKPRPAQRSFRGATHSRMLGADTAQKVQEFNKDNDVTLFITLQAALATFLSRYSGEEDIVIGFSISNRVHKEIESLIGFFANTLVLRSDLSGNPRFSDFLNATRDRSLSALSHQHLPFELLVEELNPERSLSHSPVFQIMLVVDNNPVAEAQEDEFRITPVEQNFPISKFDLTLFVNEIPGEGISLSWAYATDLFEAATIERMAQHFEVLLDGILSSPELTVGELPLLTQQEHEVLKQWNATEIDYPKDKCLHELFEAQVDAHPENVAVRYGDLQLSYTELNERANQLAHYLVSQGVTPDTFVGVCIERSIEMLVGLLGVMKAGCAYVPLDPNYPQSRFEYILEDSQVNILITQSRHKQQIPLEGKQVVYLDNYQDVSQSCPELAQMSTDNLPAASLDLNSGHLVYIIYTSGSTGKPKGVAVNHQSVSNFLSFACRAFMPEHVEGAVVSSTLAFDATVGSLYPPLCNGGYVELLPDDDRLLSSLEDVLLRTDRSLLFKITPAHLKAIASQGNLPQNSAARHVLVIAGEQLTENTLYRWKHELLPTSELINEYGPTEATVGSSTYHGVAEQEISSDSLRGIPIGKPLDNIHFYVVNEQWSLQPVGVPGELYIGGECLAREYLNQPVMTQEKFVQDPFSTDSNKRLYKTGDQVRWLASGDIEFIGRFDHQVKIRGFRIELGEIESQLLSSGYVKDCIVLAREDDKGEKRLTAYVVKLAEVTASDNDLIAQLRDFVSQHVPDYMVPAAFTFLEDIPLTPNGKVDRKALLSMEDSQVLKETYVAPRTALETQLCEIWQEILEVDQIGIEDNFFASGGDSILSIQVISRAREFDIELNMRQMFEGQTIAAISQLCSPDEASEDNSAIHLPAISAVPHPEYLPLSFTQRRLWIVSQVEDQDVGYNLPAAFTIEGDLDVEAMRRSFEALIERHATLRTVFREDPDKNQGQPYQEILQDVAFNVEVLDLSDWAEAEQNSRVKQMADEDAVKPFDLSRDLMVRLSLIKLAPQRHVMLLNRHHIASDAWSLNIMIRELSHFYEVFERGDSDHGLPALPLQYVDYALWQHQWMQGDVLEDHLNYWREALAGIPQMHNLPLDKPRPAQRSYRGSSHIRELSPETAQNLSQFNKDNDVTLFMTLQAVLATFISRYSGEEDVVIGFSIANRVHKEIESLIGFFANTLVLRSDLSGNPRFSDFLKATRDRSLSALSHQHLPFELLVEELNPERSLSHSPLFQIMLVVDNNPMDDAQQDDFSIKPIEQNFPVSKFDLTLFVREMPGQGISLDWGYATDLFEAATIERMAQHFEVLLEGIFSSPELTVGELPLLTQQEHEVLKQWNATEIEYPKDKCLHELFEAQVDAHPDNVAVRYGDLQLSYTELNERANQLAHYLVSQGVTPDTFVGVCIERSIEMLVGLLGVMKAGCAYVPLDPNYPQSRFEYILEDSQVNILITQSRHKQQIPLEGKQVVYLDNYQDVSQSCPELAQMSTDNLPAASLDLNSGHLVYIIYTSGSTGKPKGVAVNHQSVSNFLSFACRAFMPEHVEGAVVSSTLAFDATVGSLYPPLCNGGYVELLPDDDRLLSSLEDVLLRTDRSLLFKITPAHLKAIASQGNLPQNSAARHVLVIAGEQLTENTLYRWKHELLPTSELINEYGPTEATVGSSTYHGVAEQEISADSLRGIPIGKPLDNIHFYVVNEQWSLQPVGVPGELYIGGECLAREYLNQPVMTQEKFVQDPFSTDSNKRLYKTGDQVRWLASGDIEFIGRFDHQVKIRGFRIELGEIESQLLSSGYVKDCIVLAREDDKGEKRLTAYVVKLPDVVSTDNDLIAMLRDHVGKYVPDYMVPAAFTFLDEIPLTPNGKVDRKALLSLEDSQVLKETYVAPRTEMETQLCEIWQEILEVDKIGIEDNFFASGGDSILSIQVISRAREMGIELSMRQMFEGQTIAAISSATETVAIVTQQEASEGSQVLLPIQQWFLQGDPVDQHHFLQSTLFTVPDDLTEEFVTDLIAMMYQRHDVLRLAFTRVGEWQSRYATFEDTMVQNALVVETIAGTKEQMAAQIATVSEQHKSQLSLSDAQLFKVIYFKAEDSSDSRLLLILHHLLVDGVSWRIIQQDMTRAFSQWRESKTINAPDKSSSYQQWGEAITNYGNSEDLLKEKAYWLERTSIKVPAMPVDHKEVADNSLKTSKLVVCELSAEDTNTLLRECHGAYDTKINDLLLAGLLLAFNRWADRKALRVRMEGHGREPLFPELDVSETLGWFTSVFPLLVSLDESTGQDSQVPGQQVSKLIRGVKRQLRALPNNGIGYGILKYMNADKDILAASEDWNADIAFNYLGQFDQTSGQELTFRMAEELTGPEISVARERTYPLRVTGAVGEGQMGFAFEFNELQYETSTMERLAKCYADALKEIVNHCTDVVENRLTLADFPLTSQDQLRLDEHIKQAENNTLLSAQEQLPMFALTRTDEDKRRIYPMSYGQKMFWSFSEIESMGAMLRTFRALELTGQVDVSALQRSLETLTARHDVFRMMFHKHKGNIVLQLNPDMPTNFVLNDEYLSSENTTLEDGATKVNDTALENVRATLLAQINSDYDLFDGPLMRCLLVRVAEDKAYVVFGINHLISDRWSWGIFQDELETLYAAYKQGEEPSLPAVEYRYTDYSYWEHYWHSSAAYTEQLDYWKGIFDDFTLTQQLPTDISVDVDASAAMNKDWEVEIIGELFDQVDAYCKANNLTLYTILMAAFHLSLSRYSQLTDIVVVSPKAERTRPELNRTIGLYLNLLVVHSKVNGDASLEDYLDQVKQNVYSAQANMDVHVEAIKEVIDCEPGLPISDVNFQYYNFASETPWALADLECERIGFSDEEIRYANTLDLRLGREENGVTGIFVYNQALFEESSIEQISGDYLMLLDAIVNNPTMKISDVFK